MELAPIDAYKILKSNPNLGGFTDTINQSTRWYWEHEKHCLACTDSRNNKFVFPQFKRPNVEFEEEYLKIVHGEIHVSMDHERSC